MLYVFVPVILVLMALVVRSLFLGIKAFRDSYDADQNHDPAAGPSPMQLKQSAMMVARIKYQALAIGVVVLLLAVARH